MLEGDMNIILMLGGGLAMVFEIPVIKNHNNISF